MLSDIHGGGTVRWRTGGVLAPAWGDLGLLSPTLAVSRPCPGGVWLSLRGTMGALGRDAADGGAVAEALRGRFGGIVSVPGGGGRSVRLWS